MSLEPKSCSVLPTHSSTTYRCFSCDHDIEDHVYFVQRRRIRPVKELSPDGTIKHNPPDAVDPSHAGVILGPEFDPHCSSCYKELPTIQELIDAHKKRVNNPSKNLD